MTLELDYLLSRAGFLSRSIFDALHPKGPPLLIRYKILETRFFVIYLHHLLTSDHARALHDHPWTFVTILLTGSYTEWISEKGAAFNGIDVPMTRRRYSILYRPAEFRHRLELKRPMWSLVLRGPRRRIWGFWPDGKFIPWTRYSGK